MRISLKPLFRWASVLIPAFVLIAFMAWVASAIHRQRLNQELIAAVQAHQTQRAIALLDQGADANARRHHVQFSFWSLVRSLWSSPNHTEPYAPTPLLLLLDVDKRGKSAQYARYTSWRPVENALLVRALLAHGANPNVACPSGTTPLMAAATDGRLQSVQLLLRYGADPNAKDYFNTTVLHWGMEHPEVLRALLAAGAQVNVVDGEGDSPLEAAVEQIQIDSVRVLLAAHADVNQRNLRGESPLYLARLCTLHYHIKDYAPMLRLLEQANARQAKRPVVEVRSDAEFTQHFLRRTQSKQSD